MGWRPGWRSLANGSGEDGHGAASPAGNDDDAGLDGGAIEDGHADLSGPDTARGAAQKIQIAQ